MRVIILGSGTSQGIPIIGCECPTCLSPDPKDKRLRVSSYIEAGGIKILIDTSPDFRQQMLVNNLNDIDAILYTHAHIDHIMGLDDIRQVNQLHRKYVDIYGNEQTINQLKRTFGYVFDPNTYQGGGIPKVHTNIIKPEKFRIKEVEVTPVEYFHGPAVVWGYRIGDFAYITDCSSIPEEEFKKLNGLGVLVLDALRYRPHPTHFSIDEATEAAKRIGAKQTYFIHITHDVMHEEANSKLPPEIQLAYDGLTFEV